MIPRYSVQELRQARDAVNKHLPEKGTTGFGVTYSTEKTIVLEILEQEIRYAEERDARGRLKSG